MKFRICKEVGFSLPALLVAMAVFHRHLLGDLTFPWDFQGSYYTHAVSRIRDGSFLAPPLWLPWGGFGIPSHQSLQDGAWYFPLYLFDFFSWTYDIVGATRLQVFHVGFGGVGIYALLRMYKASNVAAALCAVAFIFNPAFYSNSQHVDIVRGTSLIPWLLFSLEWLLRKQGALSFSVFFVTVWQFLIAAYPGIIVSGAYSCVAICIFHFTKVRGNSSVFMSFGLVALGVVLSTGLSMVKYLPVFLDAANIRTSTVQHGGVGPELLSTLMLDFDLEGMPNDVTMRDLFVALPVIWMSVIGVAVSRKFTIAHVLFILGLLPLLNETHIQALVRQMPLMEVSRFHLSDFRPIFHIAIFLFAATGFDTFVAIDREVACVRREKIGVLAIIMLMLALTTIGWKQGQPSSAFVVLLVSVALMIMVHVVRRYCRCNRIKQSLIITSIVFVGIIVSGFGHVFRSERVWQTERSDALEFAQYGNTVRALLAIEKRGSLEYRPQRSLIGEWPNSYESLYDQRYNFAWLSQGYAAFGYENVSASKWISDVYKAAISGATDDVVLATRWMISRSSIYLISDVAHFNTKSLSMCHVECKSNDVDMSSSVRMIEFRDNGAVYEVSITGPLTMIENEPYYLGWTSKICRSDAMCIDATQAKLVKGTLRAWDLPAGHYRFVTYYLPPGWRIATYIAICSAFLALMVCLLLLRGNKLVLILFPKLSKDSSS